MALRDGSYGSGIGGATVPRLPLPVRDNNIRPFRPPSTKPGPTDPGPRLQLPPNPIPRVVEGVGNAAAGLLRRIRDLLPIPWGPRNGRDPGTAPQPGPLWEGAANAQIRVRYTIRQNATVATLCPPSLPAKVTLNEYTSKGVIVHTAYKLAITNPTSTLTASCGGQNTALYRPMGFVFTRNPSQPDEIQTNPHSAWHGNRNDATYSNPWTTELIIDAVEINGVALPGFPYRQPGGYVPPAEPIPLAVPEPARRPQRPPPPFPMPLPPPIVPEPGREPETQPPARPEPARPLKPATPRPTQPPPAVPSPTPRAPAADPQIVRREEIVRRILPATPPAVSPPKPSGPEVQQITNSATLPAPQIPPTPQTPTDARQYGNRTITAGGPRVDPAAIADEVGRIEQKLGQILRSTDNTPDWLDALPGQIAQLLIPMILDALITDVPSATWKFTAPCDKDQQGEALEHEIQLPAQDFPEATITRLDRIAEVLQILKGWKQPVCRGNNITSNVTVTAFEIPATD